MTDIFQSPILSICLLFIIIRNCFTLECYVCDNQEDNKGKCIKTIKTCNYDEDVCTVYIKYGSTPYWEEGAPKQYYITKNCSTLEKAKQLKKSFMDSCTYIWYEDWKCFDYCKGDRCNFYIVSSATGMDKKLYLVPIVVAILINFFQVLLK